MFYGKPLPDGERFAVLDRAYAMGELNWDSADAYGDNEVLIGKLVQANRGNVTRSVS
jgi:aryl-alcohol dehydrogenase-like predicted oxidoreductase